MDHHDASIETLEFETDGGLGQRARIGAHNDCDGVFVSCTSLRALDIISIAEAQLGKPVISSNQALAWHLMRLAGLHDAPEGMGKLFSMNLQN